MQLGKLRKHFFLLFLFGVSVAFAESSVAPKEKNDEFPGEEYLEDTRQILSVRVLRLADSIDSLFGEKRTDDKRNKSTLRISQRFFLKNGVPGGDNIEATLNLHLPNLKRIEEQFRTKINETFEPHTEDEDALAAGMRKKGQAEEESPWSLNQENGVILAAPVDYFLRLRLRREFLINSLFNAFYIQAGWSKKNEWEEVTSLTSDFALSRTLLFRFVNEVDWGMTNNTLGSIHGPSLIQEIAPTEAISYDLRLNTLVENKIVYSNRASLGATYRRLLPIGWIFLELNPELAWEKETNFRPFHNFFIKFEFVFGNRKT